MRMSGAWGLWRKRAREISLQAALKEAGEDDDDDEEDDLAVQNILRHAKIPIFMKRRRSHGGSLPGRRPNIDRNDEEGALRIYRDYFSDRPTYTEEPFERRYWLPREVFMRVYDALVAHDGYFVRR